MTTYRYLFADLLTNNILAELPVTGVNFTQQLNAAGSFSGSILLSGANAAGFNVQAATIPGRTAIYIDRNGSLVWGGVLWSRSYNSADQHISLAGREFESYFERRRITKTQVFTGVDQFTIANTLINDAQGATNGNIGVITPSVTSGVTLNRTFFNYELKTVYQALLDISRATNGFDFNISVAYDGAGNPAKTLNMASPKAGTRYSATNPAAPVWEFPSGNIVEYQYPEDGSIAANSLFVTGAYNQNSPKLSTDTAKLTAGWPKLEDSANFGDIIDNTLLSNLAAGQLAAVSYPPTTLTIVAPPYVDPVFGSYQVGDDMRVRITDDFFPGGLDQVYRLVALNVTPGENSAERVTLTLTLPTT
jgi:hypothetical protein